MTATTGGKPTEPVSRDERTEEPGRRVEGTAAGNGAISSMSIGSRLSEARGTSFETKWLTLLVVLPEMFRKRDISRVLKLSTRINGDARGGKVYSLGSG